MLSDPVAEAFSLIHRVKISAVCVYEIHAAHL